VYLLHGLSESLPNHTHRKHQRMALCQRLEK
jgi:hypothetical protein